ncbi:MAG: EAL domain-containing protein [Gammaproteobacteria bacterium]|nr:EAL domain-containing protein [Gammaproteobacteria bacterium]
MAGDATGTSWARRAWLPLLAAVLALSTAQPASAAGGDARPTLRFGGDADYPPYHFLDDAGHADGFDVALTRAIADDLGMDAAFELGDWGDALEGLERGDVDLVPMFWSEARSRRFVFTEPILLRHHGLFGHYETPTVESLEALANVRVAVQESGLAWEALRELDRPGVTIIALDNEAETLALVARGGADYALAPTGIGYHAIQNSHLPGIVALSPPLLERKYVFGLARGNERLAARINDSLEHLRRDGVQNRLYVEWIGGPAPPDRAGGPRPAPATLWILGALAAVLLGGLTWLSRGRDRTRPAAARGSPPIVPDPQLMAELRESIAAGSLGFALQPKVDLRSGRVIGAELLARWDHPRLGPLAPDAFVPMAERMGCIGEMTLHLVRRGLEHGRDWPVAAGRLHVSINVSANDLADSALVDAILEACSGGGPSLMLEVTETEVMREPERVAVALPRLRAHGIRISVDDFGAGHSSLVNLRRLGPDELKIDRSFVGALLASHSDRAIVRATIHLGHELGAKVAAEGIEDEATRDWLMRAGCDIGQGYALHRPMSPADFLALLHARA